MAEGLVTQLERIAAGALGLAAVLVSFWYLPESTGPLTLGRGLLACAAVAVLVLVVRRRRELGRPPGTLMGFCAALVALVAVAVGSVALGDGCRCVGALYGLVEVAAVAVLSAVLVSLQPRSAVTLLLAAGAGAAMTAALALVGVDGLGPNAEGGAAEGRLAGPLGNPNFLGFLVACGLPLLLVAVNRGRLARIAAAVTGLLMVGALAATFSRGALIAAAAGTIVAVAATRRTLAQQLVVVASGVAASAVLAAVVSGAYDNLRTTVNFTEARRDYAAVDRNGWDARAQGPIPRGPARMANTAPGVLTVTSRAAGEGLSRPVGRVADGGLVSVEFWAKTAGPYLPVRYGLQDNLRFRGPVVLTGALSTSWRRFRVAWRARGPAPDARFYLWQTGGRAKIHLSRVRLRRGLGLATPLDLTLRGSVVSQLRPRFERAERDFVQARLDALEVAGDAFLDAPATGIGWQRFSEYSGRRLAVGPLSTHNEYVRILAELGVLGALALLAVLLTVYRAARGLPRSLVRTASLASLVTGAVGLMFVNALVMPPATLPLAITAGVVAGGAKWKTR